MDTNPILETKRLILRRFTLDDVDNVRFLAGDIEIAANTLSIPYPYGREDAEKWIVSHKKQFEEGKIVDMAITLKDCGTVIGAVGLMIKAEHNNAELGYWIGKDHWSNGYATEAALKMVEYGFDKLGLNRINSHHFGRNPASGRVMKKAGMSYEGTLRQHILKWGNYEDMVCYGICRGDYSYPITKSKAGRSLIFAVKPPF